MPEKPLFIPLKTEWFEAFAAGCKTTEYRRAAGPWNAKTCRIGRRVILSKGYGKHARMKGRIVSFRLVAASRIRAAKAIYPDADMLAAIRIRLDQPTRARASA